MRSSKCDEAGQSLHCRLTALDKLGMHSPTFEVHNVDALASAPIDRLKQVGDEALSRRLTYLLEPITPVEIDARPMRRAAPLEPAAKG